MNRSLRVGLTGAIGAGKTFVAGVWRDFGAGVVEGDAMGRLALGSDADLRLELVKRFGREILDAKGDILRAELAKMAFKDAESQRDLTSLTFPALYRFARARMEQLGIHHSIVVFDAALIFEWGIAKDFDLVVVVAASEKSLIQRSSLRLGITAREAQNRLISQISPEEKARRAGVVIRNAGSLSDLEREAGLVWEELLRRSQSE